MHARDRGGLNLDTAKNFFNPTSRRNPAGQRSQRAQFFPGNPLERGVKIVLKARDRGEKNWLMP